MTKLPDYSYTGTCSGTNTYTVTFSPTLPAFTNLTRLYLKFTNASTGSATINPDGLGAKKIFKTTATQAGSGDIISGQIYILIYDSTLDSGAGAFVMIGGTSGAADFVTLTDGTTVTWDTDSARYPLAILTSTQNFTFDMTNVVSGAQGVLKVITGTASAIVITFDTSFTNKRLGTVGEEVFTTYTIPAAASGKEYIIGFIVQGTTIHWVIPTNVTIWTDFTQTFVGFSGSPSYVCRYLFDEDRKTLDMQLYVLASAATGTVFTFELPVAAGASTAQLFACQVLNNSINVNGCIQTRVNSTTVDVYATIAFGPVASTGNRGIRLNFRIETI